MQQKIQKSGFGQRINNWLDEPAGETFRDGKWRFWFPVVCGFTLINATLTALVFSDGGRLQNAMGAVLVGVGGLVAWICVGCMHYSDSHDSKLARGVSALDSITLLFVVGHLSFLLWTYGHLKTLQAAEADYKAQAEVYNVKAEKVSEDNAKIAASAERIAVETTKAERLKNDAAYQMRKAVEAGARVQSARTGPPVGLAPALSTAAVELEKPTKPAGSSTAFLTKWDALIRILNFGELALAIVTLIFIRNRSAATNARCDYDALHAGHWGDFENLPDGARRRGWVFTNPDHPSYQKQSSTIPRPVHAHRSIVRPQAPAPKVGEKKGNGVEAYQQAKPGVLD